MKINDSVYIVLVLGMYISQVCLSIPLPGVRMHEIQEETSAPESRLELNKSQFVFPSFRGIVPALSKTFIHSETIPKMATVKSAQVETPARAEVFSSTANPLEMLLNKLYGSEGWKAMLDKVTNNIPTTNIPIPKNTIRYNSSVNTSSMNGFYNTQLSGGKPPIMTVDNLDTSSDSSNTFEQLYPSNKISRFTNKVVGSHQSTATPLSKMNSTMISNGQEWKPLSMNPNTPVLFMKEQHHEDPYTVSTTSPIHLNQKPQQMNQGTFNPNLANLEQGLPGMYQMSNTSLFNPNKINNQQNIFRPNTAFEHFVTQTGSNGEHRGNEGMFDANAVNEHFMAASVGTLFSANKELSMPITESPYGHEQSGYQFSAYKDAKPQTFDASALNQALIGRQMNIQQPIRLMPMSGTEIPTINTKPTLNPVARIYPTSTPIQKSPDIETIAQHPHATEETKPYSSYENFVPGNLFPGMKAMTGRQMISGARQDGSPPAFLRNMPITSGRSSFDPNTLNAAQNMYNPNSISWISTREVFYGEAFKNSTLMESSTTPTTTKITPSKLSNTLTTATTSVPLASRTLAYNSATVVTPSNMTTTYSSAKLHSSGFDPNNLNAHQGQTDFVPGQMSPLYNGYMAQTNSGGQGKGDLTNVFGSSASMNFNIAQLLGVGQSGKGEISRFGQDIASFSSNVINGMTPLTHVDNGNQSKVYNTSVYSFGFTGTSFDPNAANAGFGHVLDNNSGTTGFIHGQSNVSSNNTTIVSNGTGSVSNGFDPNTVNIGFGSGGFSMGTNAGVSSAYASSYDANEVNINSIQNHLHLTQNGNEGASNFNTVNYLLGIVPDNGGRKSSNNSSAFIFAFNPNTVNSVSYNPNKFNQAYLHFDPTDMLAKNPGIDKELLTAAGNSFNPDKINSPDMQQALSPIDMFSANSGIGKAVLEKLKLDSNSAVVNKSVVKPEQSSQSGPSPSHEYDQHQQNQNVFDPVRLMAKLMLSSASFLPGDSGTDQQGLNPSSMFSPDRQTLHSSMSTRAPTTSQLASSLSSTSYKTTTATTSSSPTTRNITKST